MTTFSEFKQSMHQELDENILNFWLKMQDFERGGFYCYADFDGNIDASHDKSVLLHSRILWSFSAAYRVLGNSEYLAAAKHAFEFIKEYALDVQSGGVFWMLNSDGQPTDSQKHVYNQSFAIYALSEYFRVTQDNSALVMAIGLFNLIEQHGYDVKHQGYHEAFDVEWNAIDNHLVCDTEEGVLASKSMNTHLHIMEAYANLMRVWPNELLETRIEGLLCLFKDRIVNESLHFGLFFNDEWQCVSIDTSYGHDIEGTWLLDDAASVISNQTLANEIYQLTTRMAEVSYREGRDNNGAMFNELQTNRLLDSDRIWWVQAEAMVGFYNAFEKGFAPHFYQSALECWNVITTHLIDRDNGEWFWKVDRNGNPDRTTPKVEPWKCPYHNARACLEIYSRIHTYEERHYARG